MSVGVVILAAGKGTRMKSDRAKVLHEACGRTLLGWALSSLDLVAAQEIAVVVGHQAEEVAAACPDIRLEDGNEVFVHHSDIQGSGFRSLRDGAEVELDVERADRGPRARNVTRLDGETSEEGPLNQGSETTRDKSGGRNDSGRSRARTNRRSRSDSADGRQARKPAGSAPELQTLDEQIRRRLASRFTFRS